MLPQGTVYLDTISVDAFAKGPLRGKLYILVESHMMIFVADDDLSVGKALKRLLSSAGFKVETFGFAEEVLRSGRQSCPTCLSSTCGCPD
jgi:hypothetical protein